MTVDFMAELWRPDPGANTSDPLHAYALIDHAGATGLTAELDCHPSLRWRSLFDGSREAGAINAAPVLVELGPVSEQPRPSAEVLTWWLTNACARSNAVLCLQSTMAMEALAAALKVRVDANLSGDMPVMLRYFDTRIFEPLLTVLTPEQVGDFLGVASKWVWFDRSGRMQSRSTIYKEAAPWPAPFVLTDDQAAALIEVAEPDAVLALMRQGAPDLCDEQDPTHLHAVVSRTLPVARRFGVTDARQQALFCLTEIEASPAFHEHVPWRQALESAAASGTVFAEVLGKMPAATSGSMPPTDSALAEERKQAT